MVVWFRQMLRRILGPPSEKPSIAAPTTQEAPDQYLRAIDTLRATAKWLVTIFAAIAGVLTAGIQLSGVGRLDLFSFRMNVAAISAFIALLSIGVILWFIVEVLIPSQMTLIGLAKDEAAGKTTPELTFIKEGEFLGNDFQSVKALSDRYTRATDAEGAKLFPRVKALIDAAYYFRMRRRFRYAVVAVIAGGVIAALAIGVFSWAANPPNTTTLPPFRIPVEATVQLSQGGKAYLAPMLGAECVQSPVHVVIIAATLTSVDVVTVPTSQCQVARFTIGSGPLAVEGHVDPLAPVSISPVTP